MFEVERQLWWYQILHRKVLSQITSHFRTHYSDLKILDAACGTGGLLSFLEEKGFQNLTGFDYSQHAINFSLERNLDVRFGDLRKVEDFLPDQHFDIICCNDALYFLTDEEIVRALKAFKSRLLPGGMLLINIHAFEVFSGTHDLAVGSSRRFTLKDFKHYSECAELKIQHNTYWPFVLSLPILMVRQWQKIQIKMSNGNGHNPDSDVSYPGDLLNGIFKTLTALEEKMIPTAPFGSSLFLVLQKD